MESNKKRSFSTPTLLKRALAYLLVTAMVISGFNMVPMAKLTAEAATIGIGSTWYVGDTVDFAGKYIARDDAEGYIEDFTNILDNKFILQKPTYNPDWSQWRWKTNDGNATIQITAPDDKKSADMVPVGFKIKSGKGTEKSPYKFELVYVLEPGTYKIINVGYPSYSEKISITKSGDNNVVNIGNDSYTIFSKANGYYIARYQTQNGYYYPYLYNGRFVETDLTDDEFIGYRVNDSYYASNPNGIYWNITPIRDTTVTFINNAEDATGTMESKTFENGKVVNAVTNGFSRAGYSFDGFYTAETGGTKVFDSNGNPCAAANYIEAEGEGDNQTFKWVYTGASLTLYAQWKRIYTNVTFDGNAKDNADKASAFFAPEGDVAKPTSVIRKLNVGDSFATAMPIPERKGFKFDGYYTVATDGDMVFDAEGKPYIKADQESAYFAVSEEDDEKVTWKYLKEGNEDADKLTLYAHWSRAYTNVTFDKNATKAKFNGEVTPIKFEAGKAVPKIPVATYDGFKFDGYYTKNNEGKKGEQVFDEKAEPVVKENGGYFAVAEESDDEGAPEAGTIVWKDVDTNLDEAESFYAYWTRTQTKITFTDNMGVTDTINGGNEDITYKVGDVVKKVNVPSRTGFEFGGYYPTINGPNTGEDNTQVFDDAGLPVLNTDYIGNDGKWLDSTSARNNLDDNSTESLTLYAWWIPRKDYTISYYDREWLNSDISEGSYNITYVRTGDKQTDVKQGNFEVRSASEAGIDVSKHEAYTFEGWSTKQNAAEPEYVAGKQYKASIDKAAKEITDARTAADAAAKKAAEEAAKKAAEEAKLASPEAKAANALALNSGLKVSQTGSKLNVSWGAVEGAEEYGVFVQYCGKKFAKKATATTKTGTTSVKIKKLNGKSLKLKKNYKIYVVAYRTINGKKTVVGKTLTAHVVGRKNTKYSNPKKLTIKSSKAVTLSVGKTSKIKAKVTLVSKNRKSLSNAHAKKFRYASTDTSVAKVSSSGKITAVGKGTCTIYVYARNGYAKTVTVTVK